MEEYTGKFIVVEGCDGSGKTTLIKKLKEYYKKIKKDKIIFLKEPGSTKLGECIRDMILKNKDLEDISVQTQLYLFMAARIELIEKVIKPKLKEGYTVICDRFALSTWVYQNAMDSSLSNIIKFLIEDLSRRIKVDGTIYLSIDASTAISRINNEDRKKDNNSFDEKDAIFYGSILLWYNMGLLGVEFPKNLLGEVINIDASLKPKDIIDTILEKDLFNEDIKK